MFKTMKQLFTSTNKDLRHRIYFTLGALMIFILGISIRVPGTQDLTSNLGFLELINTLGGGALQNFSIFALGVMPYITASIIMQLLQMDIIPYFAELRKQGATGRQKLNQITRYLGIAFAFIEGYAFAFAFIGRTGDVLEYLYIATVLTAGTAFLLWLGDQITQKGIGNGTSLIIMAGIIATLPQMFIDAFTGLVAFDGTAQVITLGVIKFILFVIVYFAIVIGMIFVQESERRIPIQYANKSTSAYGKSAQSFMPIKINTAGVIPVIFASSLLAIPGILAQVIKNETFTLVVQKYLTYTTPVGFLIYVVFIFFFAYFYTFIQVKPEEFAKNLQENGGYVPGIRPGEDTKKHVSKILSRLTILGATFLIVIAGLPILFSKLTSLPTSVSIGGTGLLIVVGVALETYKQLEGSILTRSYKRGYSRR
ncbi:MAG TPA: preprotein translocase subunit SecY [Candidatus Faecimonas intestinavium]|nr:preprotein translocase subunit SecY [Bacilli bacterium]HIT23811.1 preprotein translocase subunit SecY [Candidatus Faecimonas intestinavium]